MKKFLIMMLMCVISISVFAQGEYLPQKVHVFMNAHVGTLLDKPKAADYNGTIVGGTVTVGYQCSRIVNLGIGFAPTHWDISTYHNSMFSFEVGNTGVHITEVPIFAQIRLDNMDKKINPYGEFRVGASIYKEKRTALYLNAGTGIRFRRFNIGASYTEEFNNGHHSGYICGTVGLVI